MMSLSADVESVGLFTFHSSRNIEQVEGIFRVINNLLLSVPTNVTRRLSEGIL
jgi:hypothetical protein